MLNKYIKAVYIGLIGYSIKPNRLKDYKDKSGSGKDGDPNMLIKLIGLSMKMAPYIPDTSEVDMQEVVHMIIKYRTN